jgi:hypothetical protein
MPSQSSQGSQLSSQEQKRLVADTVRYILFQDHTKYPIKKQDIIKNVLKTCGRNYKHIMGEVTRVFKEVMCTFFRSRGELKSKQHF